MNGTQIFGANMDGWIKLHRKIWDNPIVKNHNYFIVWIYLLCHANHKETFFIWNKKKIIISRGQLLTGRKAISLATGIKEGTVENVLNYLENEQQIEQQKTSRYRTITIIKGDEYQINEQQNEQQNDNRMTTESQKNDTYKNVLKNVKNKKNIMCIKNENKNSIPVGFDMFWSAYPKHINKKKAIAAFKKIKNIESTLPIIIAAIKKQRQSEQWKQDSGKYIPHPTTWLNGERWNDETGSSPAVSPVKQHKMVCRQCGERKTLILTNGNCIDCEEMLKESLQVSDNKNDMIGNFLNGFGKM